MHTCVETFIDKAPSGTGFDLAILSLAQGRVHDDSLADSSLEVVKLSLAGQRRDGKSVVLVAVVLRQSAR